MKEHILHVKTFGDFSMQYDGKSLSGNKKGETQFTLLMQMVLHERKKGVQRNQLEEALFGDRKVENVQHALQSVIYNAKKRMEKAGLPKVNYMEIRNGIVYWTKEIEVEEDASIFENLYEKVQRENSSERKIKYLEEIFDLYNGEFLENRRDLVWIVIEASRYQNMFQRCVEEAAQIYRNNKCYIKLKELGKYASAIEPFSEWETLTMEGLIGLKEYEDATELYTETAEQYLEGRGIKSPKLFHSLNQLENQVVHSYGILDSIQKNLEEKNDAERKGAFLCSYPTFRGIYQQLVRMLERSGQSIYIMLCTITDSKGKPMKEGVQLEELAKRLENAICTSIRSSDVVNHYSRGQYLILLINTTLEDCKIVQKRIDQHFLTSRQRTGVKYYVNNVLYQKD